MQATERLVATGGEQRDGRVELTVEQKVFEEISQLAIEYKTGARSLRGLFEELISPILYRIPDERDIERVTLTSLFAEPAIQRRGAP